MLTVAGALCVLGAGAAAGETAGSGDLAAWGSVLARAARDGGLDYAEIARDPADLERFLASLSDVAAGGRSPADELALWINAYNAVVAHFVIERYPAIRSVKDVDGFFDALTFRIAGEALTLDEIEERARALGDPRAHFAVVCASASCPDLRGEPYRGEDLDAQLEEQTRAFLARPDKGLAWRPESAELWLSSIFKWYAGDFTGGSTVVAYFVRGQVLEWILPHLPAELRRQLEGVDLSIHYMKYDWSLNDRPAAPAGGG